MVRIFLAAFGILLALAMSFDSVDCLTESGADDGGCNFVVARRNETSMSFAAVDELSSDEKPQSSKRAPSSGLPGNGRQSKKQKREASANRVKGKIATESSLKTWMLGEVQGQAEISRVFPVSARVG